MKVTMSLNTQKQAKHFAETKALLDGHDPDSDKFKKVVDKYIQMYCEEAFFHSMIPSGEIKGSERANPISGAVKSMFNVKKYFKNYSWWKRGDRDVLEHQINSSIQALTSAFLQINYGVKSKGKDSDMVFTSAGVNATQQIEENRYKAYMISGLMYGYLEKFFAMDTGSIDKMFGDELPKDTNDEVSPRSLKLKKNRLAFAKHFYEQGKV